MISRLLLAPSLLSLFALGCAADDTTPEAEAGNAQLGGRRTDVEGLRSTTDKPAWEKVHAMVDALPEQPAGVLGFVPVEGTYNVESSVIHIDECGADASAFPPIAHAIHDVNKRTGAYTTDYIDAGTAFASAGCELDGHTYRCDSSTTTVDFTAFGLDAIVSIENSDIGVWGGQNTSFIGLNPYTVRCDGGDCGVEPAASVFGLITKPMPCTGIDGQNLTLQL